MFKKILSVIIAAAVMLTVAVVPVSAADKADRILTSAQTEEAIEVAVSAIIGADEDAQIELSDSFAALIAAEGITARLIAKAVSQFVFIEESRIDEVADKVADSCEYTVSIRTDKARSVYIAINLAENPELRDARVFLSAVDKMLAKCDEVALEEGIDITGEDYNPMSYSYLAGELALHMIIADVLAFAGAGSWNSLLDGIYERIVGANLDIYEERIPAPITEFFGKVIVAVLRILLDYTVA